MDEQEFLERFGMTREEYGNKYGVLQDPNMGKGATLRQKAVDKVAGALQGLGSDQYSAYKTARDFLGDADSSSIAESIGVLDFTPAQIPFAIQEAKRAYDRGDKVEAGIGAGVAALEMAPFAAVATKPLKGFLRNLGAKSMAKETPIDPSKRSAMATIAAAPIAATALSDIPVGKIIDDVIPASDIPAVNPVAKKITGAIVKNVGQPSKTSAINELMNLTDFGAGFNYGPTTDIAEDITKFSSEINKAKKYFEMKKKSDSVKIEKDGKIIITANKNFDVNESLDNFNDMADYLEDLQEKFGYTEDEIIDFIDETDSLTKENANVWQRYLMSGGEGDPDVGKELGLGDESGEGWFEDDLWEKIYGSNETDILGDTIGKAEE